MENVKRLIDSIASRVVRERAILVAFAVSVLTTIQDSSFSWEEVKILAVGTIIRFLVTPTNEVDELIQAGFIVGFSEGDKFAHRDDHGE